MDLITLGGGCFWCLDACFRRLRGVTAVESGFSNGHVLSPTYEQVCSGLTGHAEVVRVHFDPDIISLASLLEVFFVIHDPTQVNGQGADLGPQYRSGIYVHSAAQEAIARQVLNEVQQALAGRVVTELAFEQGYTPAEAVHQGYFDANSEAGYCTFVIEPKLQKFQARFRSLLREDA
ncbi:peptide-methionine (S)-S-oxide reductase MsrA [Inhella gelatinilytica]|nr:peptide-methionine (S)-S-oxide reductase MsrA [Inhella gelatinilytica]